MTTPKDNTEVVRMLRDVKDSIWKSMTPMKNVDRNFNEYISSLTGSTSNSSKFMSNVATRLNFSAAEESLLHGDSSFVVRNIKTPG